MFHPHVLFAGGVDPSSGIPEQSANLPRAHERLHSLRALPLQACDLAVYHHDTVGLTLQRLGSDR